jgi:hypothetical protein
LHTYLDGSKNSQVDGFLSAKTAFFVELLDLFERPEVIIDREIAHGCRSQGADRVPADQPSTSCPLALFNVGFFLFQRGTGRRIIAPNWISRAERWQYKMSTLERSSSDSLAPVIWRTNWALELRGLVRE